MHHSGITKTELAAALGLSHQRISKLLSTKGNDAFARVPIDLLWEISRITRVPYVLKLDPSVLDEKT